MNVWFAILHPFLGTRLCVPTCDASADQAALGVSADDLLAEIMLEGHDGRDEDHPGMIHDLTHLRKT